MAESVPFAINPPGGVVKTEGDRVIEGRWSDTEHVRFRRGRPQKIGGYTKQNATPTSGIPRSIHAWRDLAQIPYMAVGTYRKLYICDVDFTLNDITPLRDSGTLSDPFSTTSGSSIVTVAHTDHGAGVGDLVTFSGASAVGGITVDGSYTVSTVIDADSYTIDAGSAASSTAGPGGGAVSYEYEANVGTEYGVYGLGWGVGGWGLGTWGTERDSSTIFLEPRIWSLDHFGQVLLASYNGGPLYDWDPSDASALTLRAQVVSGAPIDIRYMFVTPERFVIALRQDMAIDWCSQGDYTIWTPDETNTARSGRKVGVGTKLVAGRVLGTFVSAIWTDAALYLHQYTGSALVFDTSLVGTNCGLISPSAAVVVAGVAYWMSTENFFLYNGTIQPIPNVEDVRRYVFDNLRTDRSFHCVACYVARFNEVWFFYVGAQDEDPGLYVIYSIAEANWAVGTMERVASTFFQHGDTRPYMSAPDGHIYLHEEGYNADGAAMEARATLAPIAINEGAGIIDVDGYVPDFHEQNGDITITFQGWDRLRAGVIDSAEKTVAEDDALVDLRLSARYIGLTIASNTLDGYFRFGKPSVIGKEAGTRR